MANYKYVLITILFYTLCAASIFAQQKDQPTDSYGTGSGNGAGYGSNRPRDAQNNQTPAENITSKTNRAVMILSKPKPAYTDAARANNVQGTVVLRITFLRSGAIGKIKVVKGLPDGLNQQTIDAAKRIRFQPALKNGKPYTLTRNVEYTFTIY